MSSRSPFFVSARARIVGWFMLVVVIVVCAVVLLAARVLFVQLETQVAAELGHEGDKLRDFTAGIDPLTANGYTGVDTMLAAYLEGNLPEENETFFTIVEGVPDRRSAHAPPSRLDKDPDVVARLAAVTAPEWGTVDSTAGAVNYAAFPVTIEGDSRQAVYVVAEFTEPDTQQLRSVMGMLVLIGLLALLLAGVVSWFVAGRVLAPIRIVRETAEHIGDSGFDERIEVRGSDDVAQLATTFNRMLGRIGSAFSAQRRFLDDASHELRTPLTVVRGHIELLSENPSENPNELAATRLLVLDELDRMSRIVDDLMLLAKAEHPDFVRPAPVELAELTVDTVAKWNGVAARSWTIDEIADATVIADGQRLAQALMQLVSNAVAHTVDGDTIALGSAVTSERVRLWVRDTGVGLDAADRERIFERFVQLEDGARRADKQPATGNGAGLGLAIVASIAHAHAGTVRIESEAGHGATFVLDLPRVDPPRVSTLPARDTPTI